MADNDTSKIRYDDFISSVQPDPAKPESTIMLSGFIGHGPDGHARVYPDPTLGTWYDIPEGDILHSIPIADSKLGGSHIWVRANAQIKPGSAAPEAAAAPQQAAAVGMNPMNPTPATHCFVCDPLKAAPVMQPTPTVQTHCFICPPHYTPATICTQAPPCPPVTQPIVCTQAVMCPTNPVPCDTMVTPTPATRCFICPPPDQTLATVCTQIACPTHPVVCNLQPTQPAICGVVPQPAAPVNTMACFTMGGCLTLQMCPTPITICPTQRCQQGGAQQQPEAAAGAAWTPGCFTPGCLTATLTGFCPSFAGCMPNAIQNGVFTPFGR